ncbi:MAG: CDP-alcohol phosphatidyltransferase family protein [Pseudomonadales bacterium]|nr:CDP-alcohol phosphatidyltransferase family protein [Pseudomonadales bacterium]
MTSSLSVGLSLHGYYYLGISVLFIAMLADAMDGILARKYGLERDFGKYLDGFMDVLIYLVSPGILLYESGFDGVYIVFIMSMLTFGCIRLSVFNQIGNIEESNGLSYLGMPVFWSVFIVAIYLIVDLIVPEISKLLLAVALTAFSVAMILNRPFYKFKSIKQILCLTIGGAGLFLVLEALI